jgi:hypothetical protein
MCVLVLARWFLYLMASALAFVLALPSSSLYLMESVHTGLGLIVIVLDGVGVLAGLDPFVVVLIFIWHCRRPCWRRPCLLLVALELRGDMLFA